MTMAPPFFAAPKMRAEPRPTMSLNKGPAMMPENAILGWPTAAKATQVKQSPRVLHQETNVKPISKRET